MFDIGNPHEFQVKYHCSVEALEFLLAGVSQQLEQIKLVQLELTPVVYKCIEVTLQLYCKATVVDYNHCIVTRARRVNSNVKASFIKFMNLQVGLYTHNLRE